MRLLPQVFPIIFLLSFKIILAVRTFSCDSFPFSLLLLLLCHLATGMIKPADTFCCIIFCSWLEKKK